MKVPSPENQAILALCHHDPMDHDCDACKVRQTIAVDHLQRVIKEALSGIGQVPWKRGMKNFTIHFVNGTHTELNNLPEEDAEKLTEGFSLGPEGTTRFTWADGAAIIVNRATITHVEIRNTPRPARDKDDE